MKGAGLPPNRIVFSEKFACPVSGFTIEEIEPRLFSFNAPQGACPACDGILARSRIVRPATGRPQRGAVLKQGAVVPWAKSNPPSPYYMQVLASLAKAYGFDLTTPWKDLAPDQKLIILHGTGGMPVPLTFKDGRREYTVNKAFEGVIGNLNRRLLQTESAWMREELSKYQTAQPCETCGGKRLNARGACRSRLSHRYRHPRRDERGRCQGVVRLGLDRSSPTAAADCQGDPEGDQRTAGLPRQCRARLSQP
jgi:excinuclease ABC subunit A